MSWNRAPDRVTRGRIGERTGVQHCAIEVDLRRARADLFGQPSATVSRGAAG